MKTHGEHTAHDWPEAPVSRGVTKIVDRQQSWEETRKETPTRFGGEHGPCLHLDLGLLATQL